MFLSIALTHDSLTIKTYYDAEMTTSRMRRMLFISLRFKKIMYWWWSERKLDMHFWAYPKLKKGLKH